MKDESLIQFDRVITLCDKVISEQPLNPLMVAHVIGELTMLDEFTENEKRKEIISGLIVSLRLLIAMESNRRKGESK